MLPYGVKCNALLKRIDGSLKSIFGILKGYNGYASIGNNLVDIETVKPYLRSMSSMTKEEKNDYINTFTVMWDAVDWLNAHHFDYCGLIPMGLAFEAPEGMYKTE